MAVARQVHAKGLQAKLKPTETVRQARATSCALFGAVSANDDVISYVSESPSPRSDVIPHDSTSVTISGNGLAVTAEMLGLTECQRARLQRGATSVTASEYRAAEGSDALVVFDSERAATVTLHEMGFARIREAGGTLMDRFYKGVNVASKGEATAWARLERSSDGEVVYAHISMLLSN
jgi:hypothetical protein